MQQENEHTAGEHVSDTDAAIAAACIWGYEKQPQFRDVEKAYGSLEQPDPDYHQQAANRN